LGGLRTAVLEAKSAVGLAADDDVALIAYPPPKPLAQQIAEAFGTSIRTEAALLPLPSSIRQLVATLQVLPPQTPLLIPPGIAEIR
jgi:hypothetical protein